MKANKLRILVIRDGETKVDLSMPAYSSKWIIDLMPEDAILKVKERGIDIEEIQRKLNQTEELIAQDLFDLQTEEKRIKVWLE